jgi:hypothetical protein
MSVGRERSLWSYGLELIDQKHVRWISDPTGQKKHAFSSLRQERQGVDHPVGPQIPTRFKLLDEVAHGATAIETKHERNVFEQHPISSGFVQKSEHVVNEARSLTAYAYRSASLAEVLTRKAARNQLDVAGKRPNISNIAEVRGINSRFQNAASGRRNLGQGYRLMTTLGEPELNPADPRK